CSAKGAEGAGQELGREAVQKPEPVAGSLDGQELPRVAVDHDGVAEELRVPDRGELPLGDVIADDPVEERATVGVEERAVRVEGAILDRDRNLVVARAGR